jgi:hypothetical protein
MRFEGKSLGAARKFPVWPGQVKETTSKPEESTVHSMRYDFVSFGEVSPSFALRCIQPPTSNAEHPKKTLVRR